MSRFDARVLLIDVGLCGVFDSRPRMACLLIENGKPSAPHRGTKLALPADSGMDLLRYLRQAAALDPAPSSLEKRIAKVEGQLSAPANR